MTRFSRRTLLTSAGAFASSAWFRGALAQSNEAAAIKLQAFGGEAQLKAINNAIARFNKKYQERIRGAIHAKTKFYKREAASRLGIRPEPPTIQSPHGPNGVQESQPQPVNLPNTAADSATQL